ncbi:hypothetical protein M501DRAFT_83199 [Patellaria atrata CBS 101060]|uniref:F-box domain-containing protein n=1 Tax=Patellaria atrata CBS 101060 TaxID=1346257 RepID=A0A9P4VX31_9PEZI|nr:hypothetical protein M501DRAFT_83199 [Patellaria atrata CBS 101060]
MPVPTSRAITNALRNPATQAHQPVDHINRLSNELLLEIFDHFRKVCPDLSEDDADYGAGNQDLYNLCLVSPRFKDLATRPLYQDIAIGRTPKLKDKMVYLLRTIKKTP